MNVDMLLYNFFIYSTSGILVLFVTIYILSFIKDLLIGVELKGNTNKIYDNIDEIIKIIRDSQSEIDLILFCKEKEINLQDLYNLFGVSNFIQAKMLFQNNITGKFLRMAKRTENILKANKEFKDAIKKKIKNNKLQELILIDEMLANEIKNQINNKKENPKKEDI